MPNTSHLSSYSCTFCSHLDQGKTTLEGLTPWRILGMNKINSSSIVMFSLYQYRLAYELEYSSYVMIIAYELACSLYVMNLAYITLCLTIHITYMIRVRAKLRWRFIVPSGLPMSYACWSVGSESRGDMGSSFYTRAWCSSIQEPSDMTVLHGWGVGSRWW